MSLVKTQYANRKTESFVDLAKSIPLSKPFSINLELSGACNFRCSFCPQSTSEYNESDRARHMSFSTFDSVFDQLESWDGALLKTLSFNNSGEPLLNPSFSDIISRRFKHLCGYSILATNASLLSGDKATALLNSDLDYLKISIYSVSQKRHEELTKSSIDIDEIFDNVSSFKSRRDSQRKGPQLYIKLLDTKDDGFSPFVDKYKRLADQIGIESLTNWNSLDNYIEKSLATDRKREREKEREKERKREICPFPFYKMIILNNGDVTYCCADSLGQLATNNVNVINLKTIWNEDGYKLQESFLLKNQRQQQACKYCNYFNAEIDDGSSRLDNLAISAFLERLEHKKLNP